MFADKMTEAREAVDEARNGWFTSAEFDVRLDALIAAVRQDEKARCVDAVDKLDGPIDPLGYSTIRWLEAVEAIRNA